MKVALLTSSRADYGIYRPLIRKLHNDSFFNCAIIVFGTHLSEAHGKTISEIIKDGYVPFETINTIPENDSPGSIAASMGNTMLRFSEFWSEHASTFDMVFCLGDRYEMFAAVMSAVSFNVKFAHIHGGEETAGAIDNIFRHSISHASLLHFVSLEENRKRVEELTHHPENIYCTGALSLDNLREMQLLTKEEFRKLFHITPDREYILITYHPETADYHNNIKNTTELINALQHLKQHYQLIITMPNADTMGNYIREQLNIFKSSSNDVHLVENFGTQGYFSCMQYAEFLLGNSSSGIIEAASFGRYVINIGNRQQGRIAGSNVLHCSNHTDEIIALAETIPSLPLLKKENIYGNGNAAGKIIEILKTIK
ncbi:MAG: UDP-N-acetylglucosamine 2-epimerase [Bacteroidota bacterium]